MITEDYVSFEVAKRLKEKGFDEPCYRWYDAKGDVCAKFINPDIPLDYSSREYYLCPSQSMAMKWLREVHKIFIVIIPRLFYSDGSCDSFAYSIWADDNLDVDGEEEWDELYESYEDAVEAALKYALERLI